jgi:hypothetical protein
MNCQPRRCHSLPYILKCARRRADLWNEKRDLWPLTEVTWAHSQEVLWTERRFVLLSGSSASFNTLLPSIFHLYILEFHFSTLTPFLVIYSYVKNSREWDCKSHLFPIYLFSSSSVLICSLFLFFWSFPSLVLYLYFAVRHCNSENSP